ncbi:hypothetical protein Pmani_006022 [Petrolisthes manimaculis]|uniref:Insertion element IS150 protein InsJ-like helix-turn-helix domain-containing protein n=1 Tax=Petrolisthes manimaculis TaxID=1843537 RepID=A0AAE1UG27_9EUCA|nr:hypothetical protein Pmani_006022 [Petrolisthes manimaculis]
MPSRVYQHKIPFKADCGQIVKLWREGTSKRAISREMGVSLSTVYRWIRVWRKEGRVETRPYIGRKRTYLLTNEAYTTYPHSHSTQTILSNSSPSKHMYTNYPHTHSTQTILSNSPPSKHMYINYPHSTKSIHKNSLLPNHTCTDCPHLPQATLKSSPPPYHTPVNTPHLPQATLKSSPPPNHTSVNTPHLPQATLTTSPPTTLPYSDNNYLHLTQPTLSDKYTNPLLLYHWNPRGLELCTCSYYSRGYGYYDPLTCGRYPRGWR